MCGMHGSFYANYALQNADVIICVGARFDDRTTGAIHTYAPKGFTFKLKLISFLKM